ncbi:hypothetical protein FK268_18050 [Tsukamurella sputi]|uniref:Uncharacterized protein n=1 Tax=Tsukamurella sputi TaxID=2591848 RepID=A0A5C5RIP6_9ACTN|nr:hypothetical protein [Tsukamurella sputi]TWS22906.1 hypothetical protein FK268_18050 [Tsukamurella sputi]
MRVRIEVAGAPGNFDAGVSQIASFLSVLYSNGWTRPWELNGEFGDHLLPGIDNDGVAAALLLEDNKEYRGNWNFYSVPEGYGFTAWTGIISKQHSDRNGNGPVWDDSANSRFEVAISQLNDGTVPPEHQTTNSYLSLIDSLSQAVKVNRVRAGLVDHKSSEYWFELDERSQAVDLAANQLVVSADTVQVDWIFSVGDVPFDEERLPSSASVFIEPGSGLKCVRLCENPADVTVEMIDDTRAAFGFPRLRQIVDVSTVPDDYDGPYILPE